MEKIIEIDILNKLDLVEKYNDGKLSQELINYLLQEAAFITKDDKIKIIIDKHDLFSGNCTNLIMEGLKYEYERLLKMFKLTNRRQIVFMVLGIIFLFFSSLIKGEGIWKELLLIGGWVPIWEAIEIWLFSDLEGRRKLVILKKLLESEIVEKDKH